MGVEAGFTVLGLLLRTRLTQTPRASHPRRRRRGYRELLRSRCGRSGRSGPQGAARDWGAGPSIPAVRPTKGRRQEARRSSGGEGLCPSPPSTLFPRRSSGPSEPPRAGGWRRVETAGTARRPAVALTRLYCRTMAERPGIAALLSGMLSVCAEPGCSTTVFGRGTCVEHDPKPAATLTETLLNRAAGRPRVPPRAARQPPETP